MSFFKIIVGSQQQREEIKNRIPGLDELSPKIKEKVVTAWVTAWKNSSFESLEEVPCGKRHHLMDHVSEVVNFGMAFAKLAQNQWGETWDKQLDRQELIQALILHDLDKPLLYAKKGDLLEGSPISRQLPHGVLSALILSELGFSEAVISTVATHSLKSPFHPATALSHILYYADMFSADHTLLEEGSEPYFCRLSC